MKSICSSPWLLFLLTGTLSACTAPVKTRQCDISFMQDKSYYLLVDGHQCRVNSPGRPRVPSWKAKVEIVDGRITLWGDRCNDAPLLVGVDIDELQFAGDCLSFHYQSDRFVYLERPPDFTAR